MQWSWRDAEGRNIVLLWIAMLINMTGSNMLLVYISVWVLYNTGSALQAGLIFASRFVAAIFLTPLSERLCRRVPSQRLLVAVDIASIVTLLVLSLTPQSNVWVVFVVLTARGFLETTMKSTRIVAIRVNFAPERLERVNAMLATPHVIGNFLGALLATMLVEIAQLRAIALLNAAMVAVVVLLYMGLRLDPKALATEAGGRFWSRTRSILQTNVAVRRPFIYLLLCTVLFQGYHQVQRTALPIQQFKLSPSEASLFQICAVAGVVLGTFSMAFLLSGRWRRAATLPRGMMLGALLSGACWLAGSPWLAAFGYFLFMAVFEMTFLKSQSEMLLAASGKESASLMVAFYAIAECGMLAMTLAGGWLIDQVGGLIVTLGVSCLALVATALVEWTAPVARHRMTAQGSSQVGMNGQR